jgi:hypothetical protein
VYLGLSEPGHGLERREPPHEARAIPGTARRRWRDRRRGRKLRRETRPAHHPESPRRSPPKAAKQDQIRPASKPDEHVRRGASKGRAKPWSRGRGGGRLEAAAGLWLGEVVELVHGLLEAPLRVGADVTASSAAAGGHRRGARWRGVGGGAVMLLLNAACH